MAQEKNYIRAIADNGECVILITRYFYSSHINPIVHDYVRDDAGDVKIFPSKVDAQLWIKTEEAGDYYNRNGEYAAPDYCIESAAILKELAPKSYEDADANRADFHPEEERTRSMEQDIYYQLGLSREMF